MKKNDVTRRELIRATAALPIAAYFEKISSAASWEAPQPRVSPFADALAVWHMGSASGQGSMGGDLKTYGDVQLGVSLKDDPHAASRARGGDGKFAAFRGGYLVADAKGLNLTGQKHMTLCMRIRGLGKQNDILLSLASPDHPYSRILQVRAVDRTRVNYAIEKRLSHGNAIEYQWKTTPVKDRVKPDYFSYDWAKTLSSHEGFVDGVLRLQAPTDLIEANAWHDVVVRFNSCNLELFIDGVLVDEDWPHGGLDHFHGPFLIGAGYVHGELQSGLEADIDHVAIWDRALTDEEILHLCGGPAGIASRAAAMLGSKQDSLQYWRPQGINTFVGDCMPIYADGKFHLFYLFDRHHHHSKWGMGAHQFAHASSRDLIHWQHHPMTIPITQQWECSIGTGAIVPFRGEYHAIYIQHGRRCWFNDAPYAADTVQVSLGPGGVDFHKVPQPIVPWTYLSRKDGSAGDINPDIFPDTQDHGFYLSLSGEKIWTSTDLENWREPNTIDAFKDIGTGICSSYVEWNGWHYIASSAGYRMSREPLHAGWSFREPEHPAILEGLGVPQIARFRDNRCLMVGFLGGDTYAGEAVFRELVQHDDGRLGTRWVQEMLPASGSPLKPAFEVTRGACEREGEAIRVGAANELCICSLKGISQDVHIHAHIKPSPNARAFGLCVRGLGGYAGGCEIRLDAQEGTAQFGTPADGGMAPVSKPVGNGSNFSIGGITFPPEGFQIDLIVKDDFVDVCIHQQRTMISRRTDKPNGDRLFLFSKDGEVLFTGVTIRPLL